MSIWSMMLHEIAYRKVNFLLGLAGTAAAIALLVGVLTGLQFHVVRSDEIVSRKEEETKAVMIGLRSDLRQAMQRLGYNAIVLPKDQPLGDWYAEDYGAITMPESWAPKLDETRELVDRYQPRLRRKLKWEERQWTILVVGVGPERVLDTSVGEAAPLADSIPRGSCVVGYELHYALGLEPGQEIAVLGRVFRIDKCERELGTKDDISIWIPLADAQQMLNQPGAINEILIVEHLSVWGNLAEVRRRMAAVQRVQPGQPVQAAGGDDVVRTAGEDLLGRLEDQPHPAAQIPGPLERLGDTQQHGQVHVMPAGVRDVGQRRGVRQAGRLPDRQRVDVRPQADQPLPRTDLGNDPGARRQHGGLDAVGVEHPHDQRGGRRLAMPEFGVGVHPSPQPDQLGQALLEVVVQPLRTEAGPQVVHPLGGGDDRRADQQVVGVDVASLSPDSSPDVL